MPIDDFDCVNCGEVFELDIRAQKCPVCGEEVFRRWGDKKAPGVGKLAKFIDGLLELPSTPKPISTQPKAPVPDLGPLNMNEQLEKAAKHIQSTGRPLSVGLPPVMMAGRADPAARAAAAKVNSAFFADDKGNRGLLTGRTRKDTGMRVHKEDL